MERFEIFKPKRAEEFEFKDITYSKKDMIATIAFNRPEVLNTYSTLAITELIEAVRDVRNDDGVGVLVITGAGDRAFCTGGDVKEYAGPLSAYPRDFYKWGENFNIFHQILRGIGKPSIARINGMAVGGGNEFNLACDLAIAAEHAVFRQVGTRVGSVAAGGATQFLPIVVGDRRAREILLLCEEIPSSKALEWGLVNQVVPSIVDEQGDFLTCELEEKKRLLKERKAKIDLRALDEAVKNMANKLLEKFPECTRYTIAQLNYWKEMVWAATMRTATDWLAIHYTSAEPFEGMNAFVEKRPPNYRGLREKAARGESSEFLWGPYTQTCPKCGAKGIPAEFSYCGACGAKIK
jgi:enoyl-CoA hydratase/carnithine racemase